MNSLDGLRAVSILIVLFAHAAQTTGAPALLRPLEHLGVFGVEVFFAISGFIITLLLIRERRDRARIDLPAFWRRRALRILPPFLAVCAGLYLAAHAGLFEWSWSSFMGAATFTKNTPLFEGDWYFGHFWSLSMEEQFYLLWPLLFIWARSLPRMAALLVAMIALGPLFAVDVSSALEWVLPFAPMLAAGCLFAVLFESRPQWFAQLAQLRWMRLAFLCLGLAVTVPVAYGRHRGLWPEVTVPLNQLLVPLACMLLLMEAVFENGWLQRFLSRRAMVWLGRISYSVYLWQQLFMGAPGAYLKHWAFAEWPLNMAAAVVCGALGYMLIEVPVQRLSARSRRRVAQRNIALPPAGVTTTEGCST